MERFEAADRAYARAIELAPADAQLLADRADVLAMLQSRNVAGEPRRLVDECAADRPAQPQGPDPGGQLGFRAARLRRRDQLLDAGAAVGAARQRLCCRPGQQSAASPCCGRPERSAGGRRKPDHRQGTTPGRTAASRPARSQSPAGNARAGRMSVARSTSRQCWQPKSRPATRCTCSRGRRRAGACRWPSSGNPLPDCH